MRTHTIDDPVAARPAVPISSPSKIRRWTGRALSGLAVLFMAMDSVFKLVQPLPAPVTESFAQLGYEPSLASTIGILGLSCTVLYALPRTAVLGAVLLTGYFGGAIASHLRLGHPLFSHVLFPTYIAVLVWGGLYLRDDRLRLLLPWRRAA